MKKLMTILGAFMFASVLLTSCGGPESDGTKAGECMCEYVDLIKEATENPDKMADLQEKAEKVEEKCDKMMKEMDKTYKDDESDDSKAFKKAFEKASKPCL